MAEVRIKYLRRYGSKPGGVSERVPAHVAQKLCAGPDPYAVEAPHRSELASPRNRMVDVAPLGRMPELPEPVAPALTGVPPHLLGIGEEE